MVLITIAIMTIVTIIIWRIAILKINIFIITTITVLLILKSLCWDQTTYAQCLLSTLPSDEQMQHIFKASQ